jgi:hypothetical protein
MSRAPQRLGLKTMAARHIIIELKQDRQIEPGGGVIGIAIKPCE